MAKTNNDLFVCSDCGYESNKWMGKCPSCGAWSAFREVTRRITGTNKENSSSRIIDSPTQALSSIIPTEQDRLKTNIAEFDCVLGGGLVQGMIALIGGEPGVGKSTIMMQVANQLAKQGKKVLYISGEESYEQIKLRSTRLQIDSEKILLNCNNLVETIISEVEKEKPALVVIDSIQSMQMQSIDNAPGSVTQLRECTNAFTHFAKQTNIPFILIGHVTKDGIVAGPKILEHIVDTVLYFEGENLSQYKILRTTKNRFGSTNEVGIFEMCTTGLMEVANPSEFFIQNNTSRIGSATSCIMEGSRAFLLEVQALVTPSNYGNPQRVAIGYDQKRLALIIAVIERYIGINLQQHDVFLNIAGGIKAIEPGIDLAVVMSIISSYKNKPLPEKSIFLGEISLSGDIRSVSQVEQRLKEAQKLGYDYITISSKRKLAKKTSIRYLNHIAEVIAIL